MLEPSFYLILGENIMSDKEKIMLYRIFDQSGNWFYYFAIVVIVFQIDSSAWALGVLSASYTLPSMAFSTIIATLLLKRNIKNALIIQTILRAISLFCILLSKNIIFVLLFVFLEQFCTVGSDMCYEKLVINVVNNEELKNFNKNIFSSTNAIRLFVIPIYLLLQHNLPITVFMIIDIVCKIVSIFLVMLIHTNKQMNNLSRKSGRKNIFFVIKQNTVIFFIILITVVISCMPAFNSAYAISYINLFKNNVNYWYAWLTLGLAVMDLLGSYSSKFLINQFEKKSLIVRHVILMILAVGSGISIYSVTKIVNIFYFILMSMLIEYLYTLIQLYSLYLYQVDGRVMSWMAIQNVGINAWAFVNSFAGAYIIDKLGILVYMRIMALIMIVASVCLLFYLKVVNKNV